MEKATSERIYYTPEKWNKYSNALNFYKNVNKIYQILKYKCMYKILLWFIYKIMIRSTTNPYNFWETMEDGLKKKQNSTTTYLVIMVIYTHRSWKKTRYSLSIDRWIFVSLFQTDI